MKSIKITLSMILIVFVTLVGFAQVTDTNEIAEKSSFSIVFEKEVFSSLWDEISSTFNVVRYYKKGDSSDIVDYFQSIPDISTPTYYGTSGSLTTLFTPRGDKVNVAVNGLDISTMVNSSYDVSVLDPLFFDSVYVYYGPSSSRYGNGNYGGVVNFNLLGYEKRNFVRIIRTIGTSFETYYFMTDVSVSTSVGNFYLGIGYNRSENSFNYNVSELYTNSSPFEPTNYVREGAGYTKYSILSRYVHNFEGFDVDTGILLTLPTVNEPNSVLLSNPLNYEKAKSKVMFMLPYLKVTKDFGEDSKLGMNIYYTSVSRNREVENLRSSFGGSIGSKIDSGRFSVEFNFKSAISLLEYNKFLLGAALNFQNDFASAINTNFSTFPSPSTNEYKTNDGRNVIGLYLEGNYLLSSILKVTFSSRFDYYLNYNLFEYSPRVGMLFNITDFFGFRASVYRSYRLPYFDDVYGPLVYGYGSVNTNLNTEYVNSFDLSAFVDYVFDGYKIYFSITPYYSDTTNLIVYNPSSFQTENIGKVFVKGIDFKFEFKYRDFIKLLTSYVYTEPINGNASERLEWNKLVFLNYRALNSLYIDLSYDRNYFKFGAYLNYQWNRFENVYDVNFNVVGNRPLDNIMILSIYHAVRPKDWVEVGVEWKRNLIGNEYVEGYPVPEEKINTYIIFTVSW